MIQIRLVDTKFVRIRRFLGLRFRYSISILLDLELIITMQFAHAFLQKCNKGFVGVVSLVCIFDNPIQLLGFKFFENL